MIDFSSDNWQISLPDDWQHKNSEEQHYFEDAAGGKGVYISSWDVGDGWNATGVAEVFKAANVQMLGQMEGYRWETVAEEYLRGEKEASNLVDNLAAAGGYRIVDLTLVKLPAAVRIAFHDYRCEDYEKSRAYFAPIIDSVKLLI
jgi:hypothetical protein